MLKKSSVLMIASLLFVPITTWAQSGGGGGGSGGSSGGGAASSAGGPRVGLLQDPRVPQVHPTRVLRARGLHQSVASQTVRQIRAG